MVESAIAAKHVLVVSGDQEFVIHFTITALFILEQQCAVVEGCQLCKAKIHVFHKTPEWHIWTELRQVTASTTGDYVNGSIKSS